MMNILKKIFSPLNITIILVLILFTGLFLLQPHRTNTEFYTTIIELLGSFTVTFLGVYLSLNYSKHQDREREKRNSENYYKSALVLISSEIDFNLDTLNYLIDGINSMPTIISTYYTSYGLLIEVSKSIKSKAYYAAFMTQSIHEIIKKLSLFNSLQMGYNNMELAINGLYQTQDIFYEYTLHEMDTFPQILIDQSNAIISSEINKIQRAIDLLTKAKQNCDSELKQFDLLFTK